MKKNIIKYCSIVVLLILLVIIITLCSNTKLISDIYYDIRKNKYGEAIADDGTINNSFFDINNNNSESGKTTKGINKAIQYAINNNIEYIKLEKGTYLIDGTSEDDLQKAENKGIIIKSNITLDLNGATLKHIINDKTNYSIFTIINENNITIKNGIIYGDKDEHKDISGANDKGFGVEIRGGSNIILENLQIENFTGDGILVRELQKNNNVVQSKNIEIKGCNISNNRRQGISIISGSDIKIHNNEIYNIAGKNPQACIDIESDGWNIQKNEGIEIYSNKLYGSISKLGIVLYNGIYDSKICDNDIDGKILVCDAKEYVKIENNNIKNGGIIINKDLYTTNNNFYINKIILNNNQILDGNVQVIKPRYAIMQENIFTNTKVEIANTDIAIRDNKSDNIINLNYIEDTNNIKRVYYINNKFNKIQYDKQINIINKEDEYSDFTKEVMMGVE